MPRRVLGIPVRREGDDLELGIALLREGETLEAVHLTGAHLDFRHEQAGAMLLDQSQGVVGRGRLPFDLDTDPVDDLLHRLQPEGVLVQQYRRTMLRRTHRKGRLSIGLHEGLDHN